jgi:DNA-binding LacI/PurR family transcriptional regulator
MPIDLQNSTPLYLQIIDDIKSKIASKHFKAGDQIGSHAELVSMYDVSLITVKKALTTLIQQGVLYSRVGKGTYVAQFSPDTHEEQHPTIGLVLQDIRSPFFSRVMHSVADGAYEMGYHVLLANSSGKPEKEDAQIARFRTFGVKGMIIASMSHEYHASPTIRKLCQEGFPFVMVSYIADENIPFVGCDHERGGFIATEYLIKLGYQRIGYINGERGNLVGALRQRGFAAALKAHGRKPDKRFLFHLRQKGERYDYQSGYEIGEKFVRLKVKPDAMFIYNDLSALGFENAVLAGGLRIPEDVAIIGFDDIERGEYAAIPLTTIRQPSDLIGKQAMELLLRLMERRETVHRRILQPQLVVRQSCRDEKLRGRNGKANQSAKMAKVRLARLLSRKPTA